MERVHVLITTSYRGVFYGTVSKEDLDKQPEDKIRVEDCRNVIYWNNKTNGFLGLSSEGPNSNCKIGAKAGGPVDLHKITSITQCSDKAIEVWSQY